jgi:hypothetical protein
MLIAPERPIIQEQPSDFSLLDSLMENRNNDFPDDIYIVFYPVKRMHAMYAFHPNEQGDGARKKLIGLACFKDSKNAMAFGKSIKLSIGTHTLTPKVTFDEARAIALSKEPEVNCECIVMVDVPGNPYFYVR